MGTKWPDNIDALLEDAKHELSLLYRERMKSLILYGSYARGDNSAGSDIDLALILADVRDVSHEYDRMMPALSKISLQYDTVLSVVPLAQQDYDVKITPLILNIKNEGIMV